MIFTGLIVNKYIIAALAFFCNDRKEMTTDGFFPLYFPIIISLLNTTFHHSVCIINAIHTNFTIDGRRYPSILPVVHISTLTLQFLLACLIQIGQYGIVHFIDLIKLMIFKWGTGIAIHTTGAFAFTQVANKLFFNYLITDQYIVDCNHGRKVKDLGCR